MVQAGITADHGAIGEDDVRTGQAVAAQAVSPAEYSDAAQSEARDANRWATPGRDGDAVIMEYSIDRCEAGTAPDGCKITIRRRVVGK
jgi:hypothetical protein